MEITNDSTSLIDINSMSVNFSWNLKRMKKKIKKKLIGNCPKLRATQGECEKKIGVNKIWLLACL